jgi:hypothetical protein
MMKVLRSVDPWRDRDREVDNIVGFALDLRE